jgi:hypothetical protein
MDINRNVLKFVAASLLMISLPAGAQVLGAGLGGAANGALGGSFGGVGVNGGAAAAGQAGFDASRAAGIVHGRAQQAGGLTREAAVGAAGTARSHARSARAAADAGVQATQSAGANASRRAARSAARAAGTVEQSGAAQANVGTGGGALLNGSGAAGTEQHVMGRGIAAEGIAGSSTSADRSGVSSSLNGDVGVAAKEHGRASAEATAAR